MKKNLFKVKTVWDRDGLKLCVTYDGGHQWNCIKLENDNQVEEVIVALENSLPEDEEPNETISDFSTDLF